MADAPSEVKFGQCVGNFNALLADSPDVGLTIDIEALNGTITLSPVDLNWTKWSTTSPKMMTIIKAIVLRVVNGVVYGPGGTGADLVGAYVAATTQPNMTPTTFAWRADYNFIDVSPQPPSVVFTLEEGEVKDLSQLIPSEPGPGVVYVLEDATDYIKTINGVGPDVDGNVDVEGGTGGTGVTAATPDTLILRDSAGRAKVATPAVASDIATKGYIDGALASVGTLSAITDLEADVTALQAFTLAIDAVVDTHETRIGSVETRASGLEGRVDILETISGGAAYFLIYDYVVDDWPSVPASAPAGTKVRFVVGPTSYTGATWTNIPDIQLYGTI